MIWPACGTQTVGPGRRKHCGEQCAEFAWWRRHRAKASEASADEAALQDWDDDGGAGGRPYDVCQADLGRGRAGIW